MEAFAGRYQLIDLVGTGGMGSVWRAWDLRRKAYVAAKVLGQHDAAMLIRFVREQSLRIDHPHVVAPHGWAADDDRVVFAMELVRGGSVATLLGDHGPLPVSYAAVLLDQLLHGLSAVHAAGVVHRDLKPANLLLDATGTAHPRLRLSDFGIAGLLDEPRMTRHSTILGTPGYLAPEQLAGADPDPRQDLYTVGAVAAELLTGLRPSPTGDLPRPESGEHTPLWDLIHHLHLHATPPIAPPPLSEAGRLLAATGCSPTTHKHPLGHPARPAGSLRPAPTPPTHLAPPPRPSQPSKRGTSAPGRRHTNSPGDRRTKYFSERPAEQPSGRRTNSPGGRLTK